MKRIMSLSCGVLLLALALPVSAQQFPIDAGLAVHSKVDEDVSYPSDESAPVQAADEQSPCVRHQLAWTQSAARKAFRGFSSRGYQPRSVTTADHLEALGAAFFVVSEHEGRVLSLVPRDRAHSYTYTVISTARDGTFVLSQRWSTGCTVLKTQIEHPSVPVQAVDVEPFRYWGVRVMWMIPAEIASSERSRSAQQALDLVFSRRR